MIESCSFYTIMQTFCILVCAICATVRNSLRSCLGVSLICDISDSAVCMLLLLVAWCVAVTDCLVCYWYVIDSLGCSGCCRPGGFRLLTACGVTVTDSLGCYSY